MKAEELASAVTAAAAKYATRSKAPHMKLLNLDKLWDNVLLRAHRNRGVDRFGAYIVLWDIATPWWSDTPVLIEDLVIRVFDDDDSVSLMDVVQYGLPMLAEENGCRWVFTGDTQALGYMGPKYLQAGYNELGSQFCKEIT